MQWLPDSLRKDTDMIIDNLFLSNMFSANNPEMIEKYRIEAILTVANDLTIDDHIRNKVAWKRIGINDEHTENLA